MLTKRAPSKDQLAVIRLPEAARALAQTRGYLPRRALLIKPVGAVSGDIVCRHGSFVTINGRLSAIADRMDTRQRVLPRWYGCRRLSTSELFVLSTVPGSFDGRYLGPIERGNVLGTAVPIWTR
jgi:type IV secretory pathway protease TraF